MIKVNGLNCPQGSGGYCIFGHFNGNGSGEKIRSQYFFYNSTGNGGGDGYYFGFKLFGGGDSYGSKILKQEFQK